VVGRDDEEGVQVGDDVGERDIDEGIGVEGAAEEQEGCGHQEEAKREVRPHHLVRVGVEGWGLGVGGWGLGVGGWGLGVGGWG
jgi:hypothetical protein